MRQLVPAVGVLTVLTMVLAADLMAQSKPSFAGKWTLVTNAAAPGGRGRLAQDFTVTQNDKTITTTTENPERPDLNAVYNLDGSESSNPVTFNGQTIQQLTTVKWDGSKLVMTTAINFNGTAYEAIQIWSLDASGNLAIEMTTDLAGAPGPKKLTYKKA